MANEGGALIYGIGEDKQRRAKVLRPFILAGAAEKVDQIVQTGVDEPPYFVFHLRPLDSDPDRGYVVVEVPFRLERRTWWFTAVTIAITGGHRPETWS